MSIALLVPASRRRKIWVISEGPKMGSGKSTLRHEGWLLLIDVFVLLSGKRLGNGPEFGDTMRYLELEVLQALR